MALLLKKTTGEQLPLFSHHTFGRIESMVDTILNYPQISKIHAVIEWIDEAWFIRDLGGRNGTYLDAKPLQPNLRVKLKKGSHIQFANCSKERLEIADLSPPQSQLIGLNSISPTLPLTEYNLIPDDRSPIAALYYCNILEKWQLEHFESEGLSLHSLSIQPNKKVQLRQYSWLLHIQPSYTQTLALQPEDLSTQNLMFIFNASLNEEHVHLEAHCKSKNQIIDLGTRSHNALLLYMASLKLEHRDAGYSDSDQGWVDRSVISQELNLDVTHINILLFRARKQLSTALPNIATMDRLIETRQGEIRFNHNNFKIIKNNQERLLSSS